MSDNYTPKQVERRISESTLVKVQAISGLMVGSYLTMHFFTIVAANFGPESFNFYLNVFRELYQSPLYEIPMALSIPIHMIAGKLRTDRRLEREAISGKTVRAHNEPMPFQEKQMMLHRLSARFLFVAVIGHFAGTRIFSLATGILHNFSSMQYSLSYPKYSKCWPYGMFFVPYYCLLSLSGAYHFVNGVYYAVRNLGQRKILPTHTNKVVYYSGIALGVLAVGAVLSMSGVTGYKDLSAFSAINNYLFPGFTPKMALVNHQLL